MRLFCIGALVSALWFAVSTPALAQPAEIPIQGTLTDSDGVPLSGDHTVAVALYDVQSGGEPLFEESHTVAADEGAFTLYLGSVDVLDLTVFDGARLYVGLTVGSDDEMTPRLPIGTVPYAAHAATTSAVPPGAVMFFDLEECPPGWSELEAMRGRVPIGLPDEGTLAATVGAPLGDGASRTIDEVPVHSHQVSPPAASISTAPNHAHSIPRLIGIASSNTGGFDSAHGHVVSSAGGHSHNIPMGHNDGTRSISQYAGTESDDFIKDGRTDPIPNHNHTISGGRHAHRVSTNTSTTGAGGGHSHTIAGFQSGAAGVAGVDVTMPYLQLLTCRRD